MTSPIIYNTASPEPKSGQILTSKCYKGTLIMKSEFDELVEKRRQLKQWWALGSTYAAYDNANHSLNVNMCKPSRVSFCGQQYTGSNNYHDCPEFFLSAIRAELQNEATALTTRAYENELARLTEQIEKHRKAILAELSEE